MKMRLYVVRDEVAEESGPLFEAKNDAVAQRKFKYSLDQVRGNKLEYKLLAMGEIDHESDALVVFPVPKLIEINFVDSKGENEGDVPPHPF